MAHELHDHGSVFLRIRRNILLEDIHLELIGDTLSVVAGNHVIAELRQEAGHTVLLRIGLEHQRHIPVHHFLKAVLPRDIVCPAVELPVFIDCTQGILNRCLKRDRIDVFDRFFCQVMVYDGIQTVVLIFKVVIECRTDHSCLITDLLDGDLLEDVAHHQVPQILIQECLHHSLVVFHLAGYFSITLVTYR